MSITRTLLAALALGTALTLTTAAPAEAQFGKLKDRLKQKAEAKVEQKVDCALEKDRPECKPKGASAGAGASGGAGASEGAGGGAGVANFEPRTANDGGGESRSGSGGT